MRYAISDTLQTSEIPHIPEVPHMMHQPNRDAEGLQHLKYYPTLLRHIVHCSLISCRQLTEDGRPHRRLHVCS